MLVVVDMGNTNITMGLFKDDQLTEHIVQHHDHHVGEYFDTQSPQHLCVVATGDKNGGGAVCSADDGNCCGTVRAAHRCSCIGCRHLDGRIRANPMGHNIQQSLHHTVHQRRALRSQQVAAHDHDGGIQHHGAQTTGDKGAELLGHGFAGGSAAEHERPVGAVGKQDAQGVIQHIAPAVGGGVAEQLVEQGVQYNIEQGGQHAEDQVAEHFPVLLDKFYHNFVNKNSPAAVIPATGLLIALCQKLFFRTG